MHIIMRIQKVTFWMVTLLLIPASTRLASAQTSPTPAGKEKGFVFYEDFEGSRNPNLFRPCIFCDRWNSVFKRHRQRVCFTPRGLETTFGELWYFAFGNDPNR